jgi:hypothetical protein
MRFTAIRLYPITSASTHRDLRHRGAIGAVRTGGHATQAEDGEHEGDEGQEQDEDVGRGEREAADLAGGRRVGDDLRRAGLGGGGGR